MPAPAPANVREMCKLLVHSKLVEADEVKTLFAQYRADSDSEDVDPFRKYLVAQKVLTDYQAAMLVRGHIDGFFLNDYRLLERSGRGRMAGVYKAVHATGQVVAIKVLPPSKAKDTNLLGRFQREGRLVTQLNHPNIVRAYQLGEAGELNYIVMEYLDGETLQDVLDRRKRLPAGEAVRAVYQTLQGLQQVHERGMVHRDLKPANLMLVPNPGVPAQGDSTLHCTVKILDIGLGRQLFDDAPGTDGGAGGDEQLTAEGAILGTPDYLAPEQARNASGVDIRADIYSLGCVLYHLLTGQPPYPDQNVINQMIRHATEEPRPLSDFVSPLPDGLQQVVSWMMAKDPGQRYPTPERAAMALQVFLMASPGAAPQSAEPLPAFAQYVASGAAPGAPPSSNRGGSVRIPASSVEGSSTRLRGATDSGAVRQPRPEPPASVKTPRSGAAPVPAPASAKIAPPPPAAPEADIPTGKLTRKAAGTATAPALKPEDVDVELVPIPPPEGAVAREDRPLTELDRRDIIMLAAAGGGVLFAIVTGYTLAQLVRRKEPQTAK